MSSEDMRINGAGSSCERVRGCPARRCLRRPKTKKASTAKRRTPPDTPPASAPVEFECLCGAPAVGEAGASNDGEGVGEGELAGEVTAVLDVCMPEAVTVPLLASTEAV